MASEPTGLEHLPLHTRNTVAMYQGLDEQMMVLWLRDTDEAAVESERIARFLLENADLSLLFRARACVVLGCASTPGYVEWAQEAVRVAKLGMDSIRSEGREPSEADAQLLEECEEVLANAQGDYSELGGYEDEEAEETDETGMEEGATDKAEKE